MLTEALKHQKEAIEKIGSLKVGAFFMEMGTGKTRCFLEVAKSKIDKQKASRVLIAAPVSGLEHLKNEVLKHTGEDAVIYHGDYDKPSGRFNLIGIESISSSIRAINKLEELAKDAVFIIDESHLIKNRKAFRSKRILKACTSAKYRYISTGTPMPNGIEDLWAQMLFLDWRVLGYPNYNHFQNDHLKIDDKTGRIVARYHTDVIASLIAPYSFYAKKTDCLDLPEKTYSLRTVEFNTDWHNVYQEAKRRILFGKEAFDVSNATIYRLFTALQQISSGLIPKGIFDDGEFVGLEPLKKQELLNILSGLSSHVVVWCKYHDEVDIAIDVCDQLGFDCFEFSGRLPKKDRDANVKKWKENKGVLIATLQTGAVVNDWSFCGYVIYLSNSFDWAVRNQSEDRIHRHGMTGNAHYIDIKSKCGIENKITESLKNKTNAIKKFQEKIQALNKMNRYNEMLEEFDGL